MNEDTHFPRCKAGRVTPDKFEKGNTWQAGRRITIIKSLQLSGEIFFSITHLLKKRSEDDIICHLLQNLYIQLLSDRSDHCLALCVT